MAELFGWTGAVLHIDLTMGTTSVEHPPPSLYRTVLGGRGLAGRYLRPHAFRETTDPALPLLFFVGPLTGTIAPTSGRGTIMSRSPLTGSVCDCSVGGRLATQLKRAGYDGLVITGQNDTPCGIEIKDSDVRIVPTELWGQTADRVFDDLALGLPDGTATACIGPAAENGSKLASILVDRRHSAGRGGLGLIMAAKNLKYFSIKGTGTVRVHDPEALAKAREDIVRLIAASPVLLGPHGFARRGTGALFDLIDSRCIMPTDNFRRTRFDNATSLNASAYANRFDPRNHGCSGCHIRCRKIAGDGRSMPEYETMAHFTALIGNRNMDTVMAANDLCGRLGLDTISAGATLACLGEITDRNFTPKDLLDRLEKMAEGGDLGQGALHLAEACGRPETAMTAKGMELPAYDPRGACGMALAYAVNTRGGCHQHANPISHEVLRKPVATDRFTFSGKARIIKIAEDMFAAVDSLAACRFTFFAAGLEEYAKALTAATGMETTGFELLETGERICYNERIMNAKNGFTATDDDLPERFFTEPGTSGSGIAIHHLDRKAFLEARGNYYAIRGLDGNGLPTEAKTCELRLDQ